MDANLAWYGYDTSYLWTISLTLVFSVIQAFICGFSWKLFDDQYYWVVEKNMRMAILLDQ